MTNVVVNSLLLEWMFIYNSGRAQFVEKPWYKRIFRSSAKKEKTTDSLLNIHDERFTRQGILKKHWASSVANNEEFTIKNLNLDAAKRQASLGNNYKRNSKTKERLEELKNGTITLPPHRSWTGVYTNWTADPLNDLNWRFQFHTLRWINPYLWDALDGNEDSQVEWKRIAKSWAEANTPPERAKDKYAWMDMTDGNRAIQLSIGAPLVRREDQWYIDLLVQHRNWLLDDSRIVPGNHGLHQNLGLFVVSAVLRDKIGIERAIERLGAQILDAFEEDGLNEEGSVAYHQTNVDWWLQAQQRLKLEGYSLPAEATSRLDRAGQTMGFLLLPDGTMPQIGDGGRGRGRRGLHPFLDQVAAGKIHDAKNLPTFKHYKYGFTIFRSGWGERRPLAQESHTIVRHGADLRRHSHNDRGSLHIYTAGRRWITDGGFHSYQQRNHDRNYTKSRLAHSLVDLPNQKHDKTAEVPAEIIEHTGPIQSVQILDNNFETASWRRRVVYLSQINTWVVWDRVSAAAPEEIRQQWLIDVDITAESRSKDTVILNDGNERLYMYWLGDVPDLDIVSGDTKSSSKRGLIGIGWKKMRSGTSIHADFHTDEMETFTVISDYPQSGQSIDFETKKAMTSAEILINRGNRTYRLSLNETDSSFICET